MSDCIFVPAGKQEQKIHGISMWRVGYAPQLILSVGQFEWRKFRELGLESDGGLETLAAQTPAGKRHFFVQLNPQGASCSLISTGRLETRAEARALVSYVRENSIRSLLVVSSPLHLRRVALVFRNAFRKSGIQLTFVAVPEELSLTAPAARAEVWREFIKYVLYRLFSR